MSTNFYYPVSGPVQPQAQPSRFDQSKSLYIAFGLENYPGEPSLLQEIGINFDDISARVYYSSYQF